MSSEKRNVTQVAEGESGVSLLQFHFSGAEREEVRHGRPPAPVAEAVVLPVVEPKAVSRGSSVWESKARWETIGVADYDNAIA